MTRSARPSSLPRRRAFRALLAGAALPMVLACASTTVDPPSREAARRAAEELLATDRSFSAAAAHTDLVTGLTAMMALDVTMPTPGRGLVEGRTAVAEVLRADTLHATSHATWSPVRAGVSADRTHGFTIGTMDVVRAGGARVPGKYLAYWVRRDDGWRVAAFRRVRRPDGMVDTTPLPPLLPAAATRREARDAERALEEARASLAQAERDFSARAQVVGIGPAFEEFGDAEAMHVNGPDADFVRGTAAIARVVSAGVAEGTSPVTWYPLRTIVAASGDFGVTLGHIEFRTPGPDGAARPPFPYFTIWRRDAAGTWRYIAE